MSLEEILREIDIEIERLQQARDIFVQLLPTLSLSPEMMYLSAAQPTQDAVAIEAETPEAGTQAVAAIPSSAVIPVRAVRVMRVPREPRVRVPEPQQPRALGGAIPQGPVVISAKQAEQARALRSQTAAIGQPVPAPVPQEGTLDALLRQLTGRSTPEKTPNILGVDG
jgi:hypothetical protein